MRYLSLRLAAAMGLGLAAAIAGNAVAADTAHAVRVSHHARRASAPTAEPALHSSAALVYDATHDSVLYSRHADVAMPIASITKLMTALVVLDAGQPLDEMLEITDSERVLNPAKPTVSRLREGTRLSRGDLMHLALMASENRAAHALGRNYPGGIEACVAAMNAKARELGMTSSHFVEPTGLSDENVASPEDLSKLVMAAAQFPAIREFSTDSEYLVQVGHHMEHFKTTDVLVKRSDWNIVVQKTGYIAEAGRCLVMQTVIEGRNVVIVLLNSLGKATRVADAARIRRWMETSVLPRATVAATASPAST